MKMSRIAVSLIVAGALGAVFASMSYQAIAQRAQGGAAPIVATFDLERTFNTIDQKAAAFAEIPKLQESIQTEMEARRKELERLTDDLELFVKGTPKYQEAVEKLGLKTHQFQAYVEFTKIKLETEKGRALKKVYQDIRLAVKDLAHSNQFNLVIVDDSVAEIPMGTLEDLNRQISARRVFYSSADITDELISHMNAAFKAAGGVVPPAPAPRAAAGGANPRSGP